MEFVEGIAISDGERDVTVTNGEGAVIAESISKEFGSVSANISTESGKPSNINSKRDKINGFEDEGVAASALVVAFNVKHQTNYTVKKNQKKTANTQTGFLYQPITQIGFLFKHAIWMLQRLHQSEKRKNSTGLGKHQKSQLALSWLSRTKHKLTPS